MEVTIDLSKYKKIIERNIFLDLDVEKYILEHFSTNLKKQSDLIKEIQIMILKELGVSYSHHNELFDYLDESRFITTVITVISILEILVLNNVGIEFDEINFKRYENKEKLVIVVEVKK